MNKVGIIGGGAAGIISAITIKRNNPQAQVTILEKQSRIGKKILVTGNGKCNLSNLDINLKAYNTDIIADAIRLFDSQKCIDFFEELGLMVRVDESGRIYPYSEKATTVVDILLYEIERLGIKIKCDFDVIEIKKQDQFIVYSDRYDFVNFDYIVLATGGMAAINFENNGYTLAKRLGHSVTKLTPGLVGYRVVEKIKHLSGLRVKAQVSVNEHISYGEIQFKDDGISGIAIFDLSRYIEKGSIISLDLMPEKSFDEIYQFLEHKNMEQALMGIFPKMIVKDLLTRAHSIYEIIKVIKDYRFQVIESYGFKNAQITIGGINYKEVSPLNFSSLIVNNLYIVGEILNIDGICGGYNLHFAWASGYLAGIDIANKIGREENHEIIKNEFTK